jgi:hypothetical protein
VSAFSFNTVRKLEVENRGDDKGNEEEKYLYHIRKPHDGVMLDKNHVSVSKGTDCKIHFYHLLVLLTSSDIWIPQTS